MHGTFDPNACEICRHAPATVGSACLQCFKKAVHGAARWELKLEAKKNFALFDEYVQRARMKSLINKWDRKLKKAFRRREAKGDVFR